MAAQRDEQPGCHLGDDEFDSSVDAVSADGSMVAPETARDLLARQRRDGLGRAAGDEVDDGSIDDGSIDDGSIDDSSIDDSSLHDGQLAHVTGQGLPSQRPTGGRNAAFAGAVFGVAIVVVLAWLSGGF